MMCRAILWLALVASMAQAGVIHLKTRDIDTGRDTTGAAERPLRRRDAARRHVMIEFEAPWTRETLAALELRGAVITNALSSRAVMAAVPEDASLLALGITWTGMLRPGDKISPELNREAHARSGWVVDFHSDVTAAAQVEIVLECGLSIVPQTSVLPDQVVVTGDEAQLHALAEWDEVAYIFPASETLLAGGLVFPCEGALVTGQNAAQYVTTSTGWTPDSLAGVTLNYVFATLATQLPQDQVEPEIIRAMRSWSGVANVQFEAGSDAASPWTVAIDFGTDVNADPTPFPSTSTLAHTYYPAPPNPEPIAGDMHFNPLVAWHIGSSVDVYTVSLHELGHALGLGHTDNPSDVMYPYYQYGVALSGNDIAGVQSLYGAPPAAPPVVAPPAAPIAPLVLLVSSPSNGMQTSASAINIGGTVLNASGSVAVVWQSSGGASGSAFGGANWSASGVPLSVGINLITVTATDGSLRTVSQLLRVVRGGSSGSAAVNTGPSITITSPEPGSSYADAVITVTGSAADPSGISLVTWGTSGGATGTALGTVSWTASGVPLLTGENVIVIRATDNAGASQWKTVTVIRK